MGDSTGVTALLVVATIMIYGAFFHRKSRKSKIISGIVILAIWSPFLALASFMGFWIILSL